MKPLHARWAEEMERLVIGHYWPPVLTVRKACPSQHERPK